MNIRRYVLAAMLIAAAGLAGCDWLWPPVAPGLGFAPLTGAVHTTVSIVGQGFGAAPGGATVTFDGAEASIVTWTETNLVVRIPVVPTPTGSRVVTVRVQRAGVVLGQGLFTVVRGILFVSHRDGDSEIYVMNPDGSQPANLSDHEDDDYAPAWSPDGTKIAFLSYRDGNSEIYAMDADGSGPTNLTRHTSDDYYPVWSPDGTKIAFMTDREMEGSVVLDARPKIVVDPTFNVEIFVMNADGSGPTNLTDDPFWDGYPAWSPDGTRIVFQTDRDSDTVPVVPLAIVPDDLGDEIYVMDADGSDPTRLSWSPEDDRYPRWSPDGAKIAFQSDRAGNWEIYTMNPDGSGQTRLTDHPEDDTHPSWSPDGDWITFQSERDGNEEIYRTSPAGTATARLTTSTAWDWGGSWSPDGEQIVFTSERDGNQEIYRMNADGSFQTRLTHDVAWDFHPFWGTPGWMAPF